MSIVIPVTERLRQELIVTEDFLKKVTWPEGDRADTVRLDGVSLTDEKHYELTVTALTSLVREVLVASANAPLTGPTVAWARIKIEPDSSLNKRLDSAAEYLRETAAGVLGGKLHRYAADETVTALRYLTLLHIALIGSILANTRADLQRIKDAGVNALMNAADTMATLANADTD